MKQQTKNCIKLIVVILCIIALFIGVKWFFKDKKDQSDKKSMKVTQNDGSVMLSKRAKLIKINDAISLIDDAGESTYYLVCGTKKALMIDTGNGYEDVLEIAKKITDLPVEVINTHGHIDHVAGDRYCKEVWIHPEDISICKPIVSSYGGGDCKLLEMSEGQKFDLGDLELEVIKIAGHTPGSVGLLDRKHRILFSGDAMNPYIWLQLDECLPLSQARKNIGDMMDMYGDDFDYHLSGHTTELIPKQAVYELLQGCDEILAGDVKEDKDYSWFGGVGKYHLYGDGEGKQICYDPSNL